MILGNEKGFTLSELLVAAGLTVIVLGAIGALFRMQSHTARAQEYRLEAQEYARTVLDMMVREMRNTGYFPTGSPCTSPPNTNGIVAAGPQSFHFVYDGYKDGCADPNVENVTYAYDSSNKNVTRNGTPLTDGNVPSPLQLIYYPQQTGATTPPPYCYAAAGDLVINGVTCSGILAANLGNIQRVSISLTVQSKSSDTQFGGQANITMVSNADLRNRGLH